MRIVICAKEVLDPDAVNAYAVAGRLTIADDGRTLAQTAVPVLMNAYDEQAIEAALRLRDAGLDCTISVVAVGSEASTHLKRAAALGVDEMAIVAAGAGPIDPQAAAQVLAAYIRHTGGADLVLCGRQASDDDQGVVPPVIGELLGMPVITMARDVKVDGARTTVTRVTPDGDEVVACALPAVVTISNELGEPRFPTAAQMMAARKNKPVILSLADIGVDAAALRPKVSVRKQFVPEVQGNCEFIEGDVATQVAALVQRLRAEGVLS